MENLTLALTKTQYPTMPARQNLTKPKTIFLILIVSSFLSVISISMIDSAIHNKYSGIETTEIEEDQLKKFKYKNTQATLSKFFRFTFKRII